jgi:hypothetical protein
MARKTQGYNARLDESLGSRNRGRKSQSLKSRRDESKGTEKAMGKRAYSAVGTMDKGKRVVNLGAGGPAGGTKSSRNSDLTSQHKRLAMGQSVPQGTSQVKGYQFGGGIGRTVADRRANIPLGNVPTRVSGGPGGLGRNQRQLSQRAVAGAGAFGLKKGGAVRMRGGGAVRGAVKKATVKKTKKGSSSRRGG